MLLSRVRSRGLFGSIRHSIALGPIETIRTAGILPQTIFLAVDKRFDRRHRVDTCGSIAVGDIPTESVNKKNGFEYGPIPVKSFRFMLDHIPGNPADYVFVDYGCGKGRALLLAAGRPFQRVVGIEYSAPLAWIAKNNFSIYRKGVLLCKSFEIMHVDAMLYEPPSESAVLFFYSPFNRSVLKPVLDRIAESYFSKPRAIVVLFAEVRGFRIPVDLFEATKFLQPVEVPVLPTDMGTTISLKYVLWASPEALSAPVPADRELIGSRRLRADV